MCHAPIHLIATWLEQHSLGELRFISTPLAAAINQMHFICTTLHLKDLTQILLPF